jgi:hypothetical protein
MGVQEWHVSSDVVASCTWSCFWGDRPMQHKAMNRAIIKKVGQLASYTG